jgi:hypothetical protein
MANCLRVPLSTVEHGEGMGTLGRLGRLVLS